MRYNNPDPGKFVLILHSLGSAKERILDQGPAAMAPHTPSWSPDGKKIAATLGITTGEDNTLITLDTGTGRRGNILPASTGIFSYPVWLRDGNLLVLEDRRDSGFPRHQIALISSRDRAVSSVTRDANDYTDFAVDAAGSTIAAVQRDLHTLIDVLDLSGASLSQIEAEAPITGVGWLDDGRVIYSQDRQLFVVSAGQPATSLLPTDMIGVRHPDGCPGGASVVFTAGVRNKENRLNVYRIDTRGGELKQLTSGTVDVHPFCLPDGSVIYVNDHGGDEGALMLASAQGGASQTLVGSITRSSTDVSLDRQTVSYTGLRSLDMTLDQLAIEDIRTRKEVSRRAVPKERTQEYRLSPDGRGVTYRLRARGVDNLYRENPNGKESTPLTSYQSGLITGFRFSPDGKKIAVIHVTQHSDVVLIRDEKDKTRP